MDQTISPAPVRKSVRVNAPPQLSFAVFTAGVGRWCPKTHHIDQSDLHTHVTEPYAC